MSSSFTKISGYEDRQNSFMKRLFSQDCLPILSSCSFELFKFNHPPSKESEDKAEFWSLPKKLALSSPTVCAIFLAF